MVEPDSSLSAGELRQRYLRGGSVPDDELTTSQLRARHGIPSNKPGIHLNLVFIYAYNKSLLFIKSLIPDFSTGEKSAQFPVVPIVILVVVVGLIFYFVFGKKED